MTKDSLERIKSVVDAIKAQEPEKYNWLDDTLGAYDYFGSCRCQRKLGTIACSKPETIGMLFDYPGKSEEIPPDDDKTIKIKLSDIRFLLKLASDHLLLLSDEPRILNDV